MRSHRLPVVVCEIFLVVLSVDLVRLQETTTDDVFSAEVTTQSVAVPINASYLSSVKYHIKDEGFQDVAAFIIANNASLYNISLQDLLEVTDIENKNLSEISTVLDSFDLTSDDVFNIENIETTFDELNISLFMMYSQMRVSFIPNPSTNIPLLQEQLGIDKAQFDSTILYGNDSTLFRVLKESNFSSENIQKAFAIINKTPSDLYAFVKPYVFEKVKYYPFERLVEVSEEQGINANHVRDLLQALDVTPNKYLAVPAFKNAFDDFAQIINNVEILATRLNNAQLVSVNKVATKWRNVRNIADLYVEPLDGSDTKFKIATLDAFNDDCLYGPVVLEPENYTFSADVEVAQNYSTHHISDCKYVTVIDNNLIEESIPTVHNNKLNIIADFPNATLFKVGSPLFCLGKLYGIAEELNGNQIGFRTFYCDPEIMDTTTIFSGTTAAASSMESYRMLIAVLGLLSVFKLMN